LANSPQARKRARQADARRKHNASQRSLYRTSVKKIQAAIAGGDADAAQAVYKSSVSAMDKLTGKGVVRANKTSRYKSRLNAKIKALRAG
jgi:small subunit ribosomal protein S20